MAPDAQLSLPSLVVGPTDVLRLRRELESLNDFMREAQLREGGQESAKLPKTSRMLDAFTELNSLNLLQAADRKAAEEFLARLSKHAPSLHISFAVDPSAAFVDKIIVWLRRNIHQELLLRVGLQPTIAAGCVVRTPNHYYDFSLRRRFVDKRSLLVQKLESIGNERQQTL
jgi:F0F1-type ATP synthase delta subunit